MVFRHEGNSDIIPGIATPGIPRMPQRFYFRPAAKMTENAVGHPRRGRIKSA